jgi:hypothetical protein
MKKLRSCGAFLRRKAQQNLKFAALALTQGMNVKNSQIAFEINRNICEIQRRFGVDILENVE